MKKIKEYRQSLINILILILIIFSLYYLAKSTLNIYLRLIIGVALSGFFIKVFLNFKDVFIKIKDTYGETAARLFKEAIQKINSAFIGFYGLAFILSADFSEYLEYFPFNEFSFVTVGLIRSFVELMIGFLFIVVSRFSFSRQEKSLKILYPLLGFTGIYLYLVGETLIALIPLGIIGLTAYYTRDVIVKKNFIYSFEEILIDLVLGSFWVIMYFKNTFAARPLTNFPIAYKSIFFTLTFLAMGLVLRILLKFMKGHDDFLVEPDLDAYKEFLSANNENSSTSAGLGLLGDKYIYYYEKENKKELAFTYQIVNNKIIVMGEPIGKSEYLEEGLNDFINKCQVLSLNPIFYEVRRDFTLMLHDYGYDFMKFGENAFLDLDEFSLAGRKKSSLRNILNRFEKDGYEFKIVNPPYDEKTLDRLEIISDKWLKGREEKGFTMGFFDRDYLNNSSLALVLDQNQEITAFTSLMPNYDANIMTIDLMRYDTDMNVNSMMDYLFLNLFIYAQDNGFKYFNLGMAPLSNVGIYKSAYLSERIASFIFKYADSLYPFKGLRNYKSKYATKWESRYTCFAKGNFIITSILAIIAADKGKIKED
ncbi:phosphatidylglycerol lysyltransferase domain-containing protein [uncultured Anaerococcus sp.]|uniref:phosphatidylglycerol lysyltransferase domain-containing protein n=1 Tax=uncultured Anaerococcus sp. TaxID=293428 RepID=UPI002889A70F|nr:phosphatidylglycerol lysyltransferase domain-containing protein [uncultured Anaerococcus sp.]